MGRLEGALGHLRGVFGRLLRPSSCRRLGIVLGRSGPSWGNLGSPNGAKIDQKKRCKVKGEKVTSWSRLGVILGRFPRRLGVKNVEFFYWF